MQASRRSVLKGAAVAAAGAAVASTQAFPRRAAQAAGAGLDPVSPAGTTLDTTVVRGPALNPQGYVRLISGAAEPHQVRSDLTAAKPGRGATRASLLSFAHLTDIHVIDAQSPARVEFLDRYNDGPGAPLIFGSAYRPQEILMPQVADSIVDAVNKIGRGPVKGQPLAFAMCTGDNTDNCQLNELQWQLAVLNGKTFSPSSGDPKKFEGVHDQDPTSYDLHYWHPDGTPAGKTDDNARRLFGFPVVKGLLEASTRSFTPQGISVPWYTCYGNHDGLVQGNFPQSFQLARGHQFAQGRLVAGRSESRRPAARGPGSWRRPGSRPCAPGDCRPCSAHHHADRDGQGAPHQRRNSYGPWLYGQKPR